MGKTGARNASMMYPCHTSNKWKGTTQIFTKPHVIRMLGKMPDQGWLEQQTIYFFWSSGGWTCESGCWCALVLVTALFLACRGFILLFSHIMEGGAMSLLFIGRPQSYWFIYPYMTSFNLNYLHIEYIEGCGFNCMELWWGDTSQYTTSFNFWNLITLCFIQITENPILDLDIAA